MPWRREWLSTPVFLPGEFHGQRIVGYSPWGHKELDTTEQLSYTHTQISIMHLYTVFIMLYTQCIEDYKLENFTSAPFQTGGSSAYFVNLRASLLMSGAWHEATLELWKL